MTSDHVPFSADQTEEVLISRRRVGRGILLSASAVAAAAAVTDEKTAHAAPLTDPWRLGGNTISIDGSNFLGTKNAAPLIFKTTKGAAGPVERMRIGTSGNVGIGTNSPQGLLHAKANSVAPVVLGENSSTAAGANAVHGRMTSTSPGLDSAAVLGTNTGTNTNGAGVKGTHAGSGNGVRGVAPFGTGVRGEGGIGVFAAGTQIGVHGENGSTEDGAIGVYGSLTSTSPGEESAAVLGRNSGTNGAGAGVKGFHASNGVGVHGVSTNWGVLGEGAIGVSGKGRSEGVSGYGDGFGAIGTAGHAFGLGSPWGVFGFASSSDGSTALAGRFTGNVHLTGTLSKGAGSFKIDHPLDPENKYLSHSFVESPDMMNVYNGNVTLDDTGAAVVTLPEWFEALNRDFRYQLTPIAAFAPLYVSEEISGNRFTVAGGTPGLKVSWQVTGIRQDVYANANRIAVEEDKVVEQRGRFLHPGEHGKPESAGIDAERIAKLRGNLPEHPAPREPVSLPE